MRHKILLVLLLAVSSPAFSDVFGLKMGMKLSEMKKMKPGKWFDGTYFIVNLPKPNKAFLEYFVSVSEKNGLCMIIAHAWGTREATNKNGDKLIEQFENLSNEITKKYGEGFLTNTLQNQPDNFMNALSKKEGMYNMMWTGNNHNESKEKLPDSLHAVFLYSSAINEQIGNLTVAYIFNNADESCIGAPTKNF